MPDSKITALTSISTSTDPANDPLVIVDVSDTSMAATGTTKKVTLNQLLGASGTATLASATISGDLTVDTNTLKVDSVNNRVGVGTASPAVLFHAALPAATFGEVGRFYDSSGNGISFTANASFGFNQITSTGAQPLIVNVNSSERYRIASDGVVTWSNVGGVAGTAMTLNATGLGIGMGPANNLSIGSATYASFGVKIDSITQSSLIFKGTPDAAGYEHAKIVSGRESSPFTYGSFLAFYTEGKNSGTTDTSTERLRIDSSGNVGIGVVPAGTGGCLQLKSGITFPATQVASSDANTLDDYEEGNWTPTVGDASSGGNQATTATAVGRYTKIGRLVTVQWEVTDINTTGLTSGNAVYIRGLPFASSSATTQFGTPAVSGVTFSGYLTAGVFSGSSFPIYSSSSGGSLADIKVSALASGTADIWGTLTYIV